MTYLREPRASETFAMQQSLSTQHLGFLVHQWDSQVNKLTQTLGVFSKQADLTTAYRQLQPMYLGLYTYLMTGRCNTEVI
jgi:hypothetical protein